METIPEKGPFVPSSSRHSCDEIATAEDVELEGGNDKVIPENDTVPESSHHPSQGVLVSGSPPVQVRKFIGEDADSDGPVKKVVKLEQCPDKDIEKAIVAEKFIRHQKIMRAEIKRNPDWEVVPNPADPENRLINKPKASMMEHEILNPYIYHGLGDLGTLDDLARLLHCPRDWEDQFNTVTRFDGLVMHRFTKFKSLPSTTPESDIQDEFAALVTKISDQLGVFCSIRSQTKVVVGGILAISDYDFRSTTDTSFIDDRSANKERRLLASEIKTDQTYFEHDMWYRGSRGVQVLTAMYALGCPTFLLTQSQWKLFVENDQRDTVLSYPFGIEPEDPESPPSVKTYPPDQDFLKVIVICLLSKRSFPLTRAKTRLTPVVTKSKQVNTKSKRLRGKHSFNDQSPSGELNGPRKSARLAAKSSGSSTLSTSVPTEEPPPIVPSVIIGYRRSGKPIRRLVRVYPLEVVKKIEEDIAKAAMEAEEAEAILQRSHAQSATWINE